jgi:hypothetical protein
MLADGGTVAGLLDFTSIAAAVGTISGLAASSSPTPSISLARGMCRSNGGASVALENASLFLLSDYVLSKFNFMFIESCSTELGMLLVIVANAELSSTSGVCYPLELDMALVYAYFVLSLGLPSLDVVFLGDGDRLDVLALTEISIFFQACLDCLLFLDKQHMLFCIYLVMVKWLFLKF